MRLISWTHPTLCHRWFAPSAFILAFLAGCDGRSEDRRSPVASGTERTFGSGGSVGTGAGEPAGTVMGGKSEPVHAVAEGGGVMGGGEVMAGGGPLLRGPGTESGGGEDTSGGSGGVGANPGSGGVSNDDAVTGSESTGGTAIESTPRVLGATPPMGWNSWNTFQCNISESLIRGVADTLVSSGMQAAGYEYVSLDDCWMDGRDASGALRWNTTKFPSGIPALAEYVHGKGLKFGIYQSANVATCVGLYGGIDRNVAVGSLAHEDQDAATFASWGVDFLKYDLCAGQRSSIIRMGAALRAGTRPILYSINPGNGENDLDPPRPNWDMAAVAHIWRMGFDINASWAAVIRLIDQNANLYDYAAPGGFNDPDMLEVGKLANADEDRAHFAMWAIMAAPLIAGNDIRAMSATTRDILTNEEVIAVDQDPLGLQGRLVTSAGADVQVWSKTLSGPDKRAVALFNRGATPASISVRWSALGLPARAAAVRDLWTHADLGSFDESYTASSVPAHGVAMLRVTSAP